MKKTSDITNESIQLDKINELRQEVETLASYIRARDVDNVIARENSQLRATNQSLMETVKQLKGNEKWRVENMALLKDIARKLACIRASQTSATNYTQGKKEGLTIAIDELKKIWEE